ncbi:MAG: DNA polymerase/3'-5' exonuclease PolX [Candidatus Aenigmarchaeota archaeon]|nr:DNA polymerase/3'-5' exonuclease PolX [Candidatus Aenigmarchaeota archaeon]
MRRNMEVANILNQVALLLEVQNVAWKPKAYRKAAETIENTAEDIDVLVRTGKLQDLPGIGIHIAKKIEEIVKTGKLTYLEKLKKEVPVDIESLSHIEGMGPKTIKLLYDKLHVKNVRDVLNAAQAGKIRDLPGMGEKREQLLLAGAQRLQQQGVLRMPRGFAVPIAEELIKTINKFPGTQKAIVAGSYRRGKDTIGDLDILVVSTKPEALMHAFTTMRDVAAVLAQGATKSSVRLTNGLQVDVRAVKASQYGSALQYFTGSKEHSVELRKRALKMGYTLSEYGLFTRKDKTRVASKTEEDIYAKLGLQYIPPEMREQRGEIQLAQHKKLPALIEEHNVHGDFQTQTTWSDGANSIPEMIRASQALGWSFVTITDHAGGIGIAHPLDEPRLKKQGKEIDALQKKIDIRIFKGVEADISKNGTLAISKAACNNLDVVLASIHSAFRMPKDEMTKRICTVLETYPVHVLAHPTGRLINTREGVAFDVEKVFQTAKDHDVFLEINGQPSRMDLNDELVHRARELGCKFVISSDAHSADQLRYVDFGVMTARRGWLEKKDVLNTKSVKDIEHILHAKK